MTKDELWLRLSEPQYLTTYSRNYERPHLVHYTSLDVLKGIVKRRQLWFAQPSSMNDFSEISGGLDCLKKIDSAALSPFIPSRQLIHSRSPAVWEECRVAFDVTAMQLTDNVYMSCWSGRSLEASDADDLTMWRAYGSDGNGVAITIEPDDQNGLNLSAQVLSKIVLMPVFYETSDQFAFRATQSFNAFATIVGDLTPEQLHTHKGLIGEAFANLCAILVCSHKHTGFSAEQEWRFVWFNNAGVPEKLKDFVHQNDGGTRVLKLPMDDQAFEGFDPLVAGTLNPTRIIKTVMIGPSVDQSQRFERVKALKKAVGASFEILKSEIPYRSR